MKQVFEPCVWNVVCQTIAQWLLFAWCDSKLVKILNVHLVEFSEIRLHAFIGDQ